jgi:hypothetical protein
VYDAWSSNVTAADAAFLVRAPLRFSQAIIEAG